MQKYKYLANIQDVLDKIDDLENIEPENDYKQTFRTIELGY